VIAIWKSAVAVCCAITAAATVAGCAGEYASQDSGQCNINVGGSVLKVAAEKQFAYREAAHAACHGRVEALLSLLLFTEQTDGEAMLDHANVLRTLRQHLGAHRFDKVSRSLGTERQRNVDALIRTAEKLHQATPQISG